MAFSWDGGFGVEIVVFVVVINWMLGIWVWVWVWLSLLLLVGCSSGGGGLVQGRLGSQEQDAGRRRDQGDPLAPREGGVGEGAELIAAGPSADGAARPGGGRGG